MKVAENKIKELAVFENINIYSGFNSSLQQSELCLPFQRNPSKQLRRPPANIHEHFQM